MGLISDIAVFLVRSLGNILFWAVLLRFLLQLARADFYNPISQTLVRFTNPLLKPVRRVIPGLFGLDMAALVLAVVIKLATILIIFTLIANVRIPLALQLLWSLLACLVAVLNIYYLTMLATIILSWVAAGSYHPAVTLVHQIAEPVLAPFRRILPPMGGIDFSPMIAFIAIYIAQFLLHAGAQMLGLRPYVQMGLLVLGI